MSFARQAAVEKFLRKGVKAMTVEQTRWLKHRMACERWKRANYAYYLAQKRECAHRPEYLRHRREIYAARRQRMRSDAQEFSGESKESLPVNGNSEENARTDRQIDSGGGSA